MGIEDSIVGSLRLVRAKPEGVPLQAWLGDATAEAPVRFPADGPTFAVGQRVRFARAVDRYPHFLVEEGREGEVAWADGSLCVRVDGHLEGAQEWGNCVVWYPSMDDSVPSEDLVVVREAPEPTDQLVWEYERFAEREGLRLGSADEVDGVDLDGKPLSRRQRQWVTEFSEHWYLVQEDGAPVPFFNPQWGRCVMVDRELHDRMSRDLFRPVHMGGGCLAWMRGSDADHVLLTYGDSDVGTWADAGSPGWGASRYVGEACTADGDAPWDLPLEAAVAAALALPVPA
jgi:hypothetical protein